MQQFQITLKNEKVFLYNRLSWFIIIILTLVYSYLAFFRGDNSFTGRKIALIILMAATMMLKIYFQKTKYRFGISVFFYLLTLGCIANEYYLLAGIAFLFEMLHLISTRQKIVTLSKENIRYPSFPVRSIKWNDLNNVLLKDSLLTIDSKNNKVIQQLIDEGNTTIDEKEFNRFCHEQLRKSGPWEDKPGVWDVVEAIGNGISGL